jgi:hypothetical protein
MADFGSSGDLVAKPIVRIPINTSNAQEVLRTVDEMNGRDFRILSLVLSVSGAGVVRFTEDDKDTGLSWTAKANEDPLVLPRNGDGWAQISKVREMRLQNPSEVTIHGEVIGVEW